MTQSHVEECEKLLGTKNSTKIVRMLGNKDLPNPYGGPLSKYHSVAKLLVETMPNILKQLNLEVEKERLCR